MQKILINGCQFIGQLRIEQLQDCWIAFHSYLFENGVGERDCLAFRLFVCNQPLLPGSSMGGS